MNAYPSTSFRPVGTLKPTYPKKRMKKLAVIITDPKAMAELIRNRSRTHSREDAIRSIYSQNNRPIPERLLKTFRNEDET